MKEFAIKLQRARALIEKYQADGLLLRRISSFAWATCGAASYVNTAASEGGASLLITEHHTYLATTNIEAPRLQQEEKLENQGWEFHISPWSEPQSGLLKLIHGMNLIADVPFAGSREVNAEISRVRAHLTNFEGEKFRQLGKLCAEAMNIAIRSIRPGMNEYQIAAILGGEAQQRGVQPIVNLIATDERIYQYRHPLPTDKKLEKYALLVLSGRKWGLVCSISRLVHFGLIPTDLQARIEANQRVNAAFIANTNPGRSLGEIFLEGQKAYAAAGYADEWKQHHQGGAAGYESREYLGTPGSTDVVEEGQAYAWNPSIAGTKMEDTMLIGAQTNEIITGIPGWPVQNLSVSGKAGEVPCPAVLEIT